MVAVVMVGCEDSSSNNAPIPDAGTGSFDASPFDAAGPTDGAGPSLDGGGGDGGGACPTTIATGLVAPTKIATDGAFVYVVSQPGVIDQGAVTKVPVSGGTATPLATLLHAPSYLAVDATGVYWIDAAVAFPNGPEIRTVGLAGGTPTALVPSGVSDHQFVVAGGIVSYFEGSTLHTIPTSGGTITSVTPAAENTFNATTDGANLYWIDDHQHLLKLPFGSATATVLSTLAPPADFLGLSQPLSVDATGIYAPASPSANTHAVLKFPLAGGMPTTVAAFSSAGNGVPGIVSDGVNVYWANGANHEVLRAPVTGGAAVTISCDAATPNGIAMDSKNVYWTTAAGDVKKLAK